MDLHQQALHLALQLLQRHKVLLTGVTAGNDALPLLHILGANLHTQGHALHLVLRILPAVGLVGVVGLDPQAQSLNALLQTVSGIQHALLVLGDGNHNHLNGGDGGGQNQSVVVAVGHDHRADQAGGAAPAGLEGVLQGVVPAGKGDVIGPGELVAEVVRGGGLQRLAVLHHGLHGVGGLSTGKLFLVGLAAGDHRNGQSVLAEIGIAPQLLLRLRLGLSSGLMDGVTLLPPELTGAQEGTGGLFPAHDGAPLIVQHGQLPPAVQHVGPVVGEHGLGGGPDAQPLLQLAVAAHGDPGHLRSEALDQLPFLLQQALGNQHRHGYVLMACLLELAVHDVHHVLPNGIAVGAHNHKALNTGVIHQLRLQADVRVPLCEVLAHGGDGLHLFFVLSHSIIHPFLVFFPCFEDKKSILLRHARTKANAPCYHLFSLRSHDQSLPGYSEYPHALTGAPGTVSHFCLHRTARKRVQRATRKPCTVRLLSVRMDSLTVFRHSL